MKKKIDFILHDNGLSRDIFRFYPRSSHIHSFDENPPKSWNEVYKVYYSWAIINQFYAIEDPDISYSERLFVLKCDECSQLPNLSGIIKWVMETGEVFDEPTFGQPAGDWKIEKHMRRDYSGKDYEYYEFQVFDNFTNQGYRFSLRKDEVLKFCDWLDYINQYALEHGESI